MAVRGVNLGGWLVLEPSVTPSLFAGTTAVDQYTYAQIATNSARKKLQQHYDTFITEADFVWLAEQGITSVRLPVGYWLFGEVAPHVATVAYVDKAFSWAERNGISILLDLHAAAGSQNGNDHSGKAGLIAWQNADAHIHATLACIAQLAKRYGGRKALLGISLLNEPSHTIPPTTLETFYAEAYASIRKLCGPDIWVVFSDSFRPQVWRRRLPKKRYPGLYIDHHHYQLFSARDRRLSARQQVHRARFMLPFKLRIMQLFHPTIIGEWSAALPAWAMGELSATEQAKVTRDYAAAELKAFNKTAAWYFWTYKTETMVRWSFRDAVEQNLLRVR